jgi:pimeloyl-ACP methyl ester carboxylesterase
MRRLCVVSLILVLLATASTAYAVPREPESGVAWHDCRIGPDDEEGKELAAAGATCATVEVPLDHLHPDGRTLDIAISRIAADPAKRRGILLFNPGGPGGPGLAYPLELRPLLGDVASQYDLIGFDPRFVGRSNPVNCGPVVLSGLFRATPDRRAFEDASRLSRKFADSCHARVGEVLEHAGIRQVARDLDAIRQALGEQKLSYYGVSWGADLGVVYSQLFPARVDRLVVDSVTDVEGSEYHHLATGERTEDAFDEWAAWVAWRNDQYHLGRTGAQVRATVQSLLRKSFVLVGHRLDGRSLPFLLQSALGDESDRELMARNVRTLLDAAAGRPAKPSDQLSGLMAQ